MTDPVTVLVVDDHDLFREALCDVVVATGGMTVAGEATSGEAALEAVEEIAPRLVIMDKRMPGIGGIEAARLIKSRHPEVVVFLISAETPQPDALQASGAAFLSKRELSPRALNDLWQAYGA